jgi:predicted permease
VLSGLLVKRYNKISADGQKGIAYFVYYFGIPALLFQLTANEAFQEFLHIDFIVTIFIGLAVVCFSVFFVNLLLGRSLGKANFSGMNAAMLNSGLIGVPVLVGLMGQHAAAPLALINIVVTVIFFPTCIALAQIAKAKETKSTIKVFSLSIEIAKKVLTNPVIMSLVIGVIFSFASWKLPSVLNSYVHLIALTAAPLAMFVVGMELDKLPVKDLGLEVAVLTLLKLVALPFIVLALAKWFNLSPYFAIAAVVGCAVPSSKTIYILSKTFGTYEKESAATVAFSTMLAVVTLPFFIWLTFSIWPVTGHIAFY